MPPDKPHRITVRLDEARAACGGISMAELARRVGITEANLHKLRSQAQSIRFSTLTGLCEVLNCQPGDLLVYHPAGEAREEALVMSTRRDGGQPDRSPHHA
ncbi:helix-turn-helix domain-containing protein [Nocardia asiatica]|uniref:helix-turn-helix domain-containing protein n=1 Tax=Nocardia asiatica TaxID=209252 RepID=UPI0007C4501F|nr:helix-turn-helix domain-containing protein [Nocardia asiatica]